MRSADTDSPERLAVDKPPRPAQSCRAMNEASESPDQRQRVLLVTGLLGAGKSTVLKVLEDLGWETIDNFPVRMLGQLIGKPGEAIEGLRAPLAIGFDSRTRGFNPIEVIDRVKRLSGRDDLDVSTLFLDCAGAELERRYNETRRRHPLAVDMPVTSGIAAERELLEPLRRWADMVVVTTDLSANDLQQLVRERFAPVSENELTVSISSFGFARGMPPVADLVFDMRFLDNPHWVAELRPQTGRDQPVADHIRKDPAFQPAYDKILDLLLLLLPRYEAQGKAYVHIAFGCTGGRHRSVFMAEQMAQALRAAGFSPTLLHRNLGSRAADMVEGAKT